MTVSVESICNDLARHRLVSPLDVRALRQRWLQEAGLLAGEVCVPS